MAFSRLSEMQTRWVDLLLCCKIEINRDNRRNVLSHDESNQNFNSGITHKLTLKMENADPVLRPRTLSLSLSLTA